MASPQPFHGLKQGEGLTSMHGWNEADFAGIMAMCDAEPFFRAI
jgi:hypothetical protein